MQRKYNRWSIPALWYCLRKADRLHYYLQKLEHAGDGQNIKTIREIKNFTQDYVATQLNMSVPNYSNIETGKTDVTLTRLEQIAKVLQIDYQQILTLDREQMLKAKNHSSIVGSPNDPSIRDEPFSRASKV